MPNFVHSNILEHMADKPKDILFQRAPYAEELFTKEGRKVFNKLPPWRRQFIKAICENKDVGLAAREAGVAPEERKQIDLKLANARTIREALIAGGIDSREIIENIKICLQAKKQVLDKHQNLVITDDLGIKLKTIELLCKLRGDFAEKPPADNGAHEELFASVQLDEQTSGDTPQSED